MDINNIKEQDRVQAPESAAAVAPIGPEQLKRFTEILSKYKSGKAQTELRIISSENWWKLRNTVEEANESEIASANQKGFMSKSGWLHNVLVSKHADAVEAYPEPNILPREEGDRGEAKMLSSIIPCVLEQNRFEETYDDVMWQKVKTGTGVYKVVWDKNKLNGLGDIGIERVNLLNIFWEPGITDIQKSRFMFHTELWDKDILQERYPELADKLKGGDAFISSKFLYDDHVNTENKVTVIDVYYRKYTDGKTILHYVKYVNDVVLYATENETEPIIGNDGTVISPPMAMTGLYNHGKYPYVFDALFPIEGSPCGYGYVDICRNPQTEIDLLKSSCVKNALVGAIPRYFSRGDGSVNEKEFLDLSKPIVHVNDVREDSLRRIEHNSLDGNYISMLDLTIQELRETSGNTETSTGNTGSGVTAASAIAALQEASGKGSRDATKGSYRAYSEVVDMCIELIRQFYDMPRKFRVLGQYGAEQYITYSNVGIQKQPQGNDFGQNNGFRLPVFDIKVSAQKKNVYTKVSQNELAIQLFRLGFFNPQMTDQALMCLDLMEFDGKDGLMQKIAQNGTMFQKLMQYMQMALMMSQTAAPQMTEQIAQDLMATTGGATDINVGGTHRMAESDNIAGLGKNEPTIVANARSRSANASQPEGAKG